MGNKNSFMILSLAMKQKLRNKLKHFPNKQKRFVHLNEKKKKTRNSKNFTHFVAFFRTRFKGIVISIVHFGNKIITSNEMKLIINNGNV